MKVIAPTELEGNHGELDGTWIRPDAVGSIGRREDMEVHEKTRKCSELSMRKSATTTVANLSN